VRMGMAERRPAPLKAWATSARASSCAGRPR
jgi:hypothetical protein